MSETVDPANLTLPNYHKQYRKTRNRVIRNMLVDEMQRWREIGISMPEDPQVLQALAHRLLWMVAKTMHAPTDPPPPDKVYPLLRDVRKQMEGVETINGGIHA